MKSIYFISLNMIQFVPYAYGFLRSYAEQDDQIVNHYEWKEPFYRIEPTSVITEKIVDPYLICASCYTWNQNQHLEVARQVKEKYPDCIIVFGGPNIPNSSEGYFEKYPYIDILIHGEGEIPFRNLLKALLQPSPDLSRLAGISYHANGKTIKTSDSPKLPKDLPTPSPYLNELLTSYLGEDNSNSIALLETNRGCPFACSFCDWGVRTMNRVRLHNMERIEEEIEFLAQNKVEDIYITDSNFGLFKRDLEIAELLVASKKRYGFPKRIRIQFAKKSNKTVFEISKLLHKNDMLWGTTLSLQSVDTKVIEAVGRPYVDMEAYRKNIENYAQQNIPTYTELILGLPLETKHSFFQGVCSLFDMGMHDDFRVFELALLPNAPLGQKTQREKYRLHTKFKPIRMARPGYETEYVEIVFGTSTMSHADWAECLVFAEMTQALHNGGYTRFIARYLNVKNRMSYFDFYTRFLAFIMKTDSESFRAVKRINNLVQDYYKDPDMPQVNRILTQPDMMEFLVRYHPERKGWPLWSYIWLWLSEHIGCFYDCVKKYLREQGIIIDEQMVDLIKYQKELMLTPNYDPRYGKQVYYAYDWHGFFHLNETLRKKAVSYHYKDEKMGTSFRYELVKNNRKKFVSAAIGYSYPYSKFRHFFHQPDMTTIRVKPHGESITC